MRTFLIFLLGTTMIFCSQKIVTAAEPDDFDFSQEFELSGQEPSGKINIENQFLDGNLLKLSVVTQDMTTPVVGAAFHLNYDNKNLFFLKYEPGEFLEKGGDPFYIVENDQEKGSIIFGETLRRNDKFPIGGDHLAHFYFQISDTEFLENGGLLKFDFEKNVISTIDISRQDISNIVWENLHLDKDGANHWLQKSIDNEYLKANLAGTDSNRQVWLIAIVAGILMLFLTRLYSIKNKGDKRHEHSVNFK